MQTESLAGCFPTPGGAINRESFNDAGLLIPAFFESFWANQENEKRSNRIMAAVVSGSKAGSPFPAK